MTNWMIGAPQMAAAFLGSGVEAVEAVTIVLAAGVVRGWRPALIGALGGIVTLAAIVAGFGSAIASIPIRDLQIVVGTALLLFGVRWLRKAMLRSAGAIALHDKRAIFIEESRQLGTHGASTARLDPVALLTAYKAVVLEGIEVVVIVLGVAAAGNALVPATIGALAACALVALAGALLRRPLARVPENALKFGVGVMLTAFGWFWFGEGIGIQWPYSDAAIPALVVVLLASSAAIVTFARYATRRTGPRPTP